MKKILCLLLTLSILIGCSPKPSMNEEDIIKERVEGFFLEVSKGDIDSASRYLTGEAEELIKKFDFNNILSNSFSGFNLFNLTGSMSKMILSKFFKEGIKSHEILEIRKIEDELYEVDVRLNMLNLEGIMNSINVDEFTKLISDNYQDIISIILSNNEDAFQRIVEKIIENFKDFKGIDLSNIYADRIITMELIKDGKWYIKTLAKTYN